MVKTVLSTSHEGLTDWIIQRLSAIIMVVYSVILFTFFIKHPTVTFADWHDFFNQNWVKVATLLVLLSILYHAWIGMWTVFTDYIKCYVVRAILNTIVIVSFIAFFFEGLLILWGV